MLKMAGQPFWTPSESQVDAAEMTKFRHFVNKRYNLSLADYWDLWRWSTGNPTEMNDFWTAVWDFTGILGDQGPSPVSCVVFSCSLRLLLRRVSPPTFSTTSSSMQAYLSTRPENSAQMLKLTGRRTCCWDTPWPGQTSTPP